MWILVHRLGSGILQLELMLTEILERDLLLFFLDLNLKHRL